MSLRDKLLFISILCNLSNVQEGSTHWIVTENGRIQVQVDSLLNMRRPYDLMALLQQERRLLVVDKLRNDLLVRKEIIDKTEDKDVGLEQRLYRTDPDCVIAGKKLNDFDLYISTVQPLENKGVKPEEHVDLDQAPTTSPKAPYCTDVMELDFSFHAFEHLMSMKIRRNLTGTPEPGLKNALTYKEDIDEYGHLIHNALHTNTSSWVLYNMAAFYWRIKGGPYEAIECLRRALHLSPRQHKDVALISLANVIHRAKFSTEAAILVHASLDISRELNVNHFTLGNIYAILGDYNKSMICYENTLKLQPDIEQALKRKHAVLCHVKVEKALEKQHRSLQQTLDDLRDYQLKHDAYQKEQQRAERERASDQSRRDAKFMYDRTRMQERALSQGERCDMHETNGRLWLRCSSDRVQTTNLRLEIYDEKPASMYSERVNRPPTVVNSPVAPPNVVGTNYKPSMPPKYPLKEAPKDEDVEFTMGSWPSVEACTTARPWKNDGPTKYPTVYMSALNKGFNVTAYLTDALALSAGAEHPLPWYPPICTNLAQIDDSERSYDHYDAVRDRQAQTNQRPDPALTSQLRQLIGPTEITVEEIGQRILTALKKVVGPPWLLYDLAAVYWRVNGNYNQAVECLRRALALAPDDWLDVPLLNLANVLYVWGHGDQALELTQSALQVNDIEPLSHFFLAGLLADAGNLTGAAATYQHALKLDADLPGDGVVVLRDVLCGIRKTPRQQQSPAYVKRVCHSEERKMAPSADCPTGICVQSTFMLESCEDVDEIDELDPSGSMKITDQYLTRRENGGEPLDDEEEEEESDSTLHIYMEEEQSIAVKDLYRDYKLCKQEQCQLLLYKFALRKPILWSYVRDADVVAEVVSYDVEAGLRGHDIAADKCLIFPGKVASRGCAHEPIREKLDEYVFYYDSLEQIRLQALKANARKLCPLLVDKDPEGGPEECVNYFKALSPHLVTFVPHLPPLQDNDLPDNTEHIRSRLLLPWPSLAECRSSPPIDVTTIPSIWPTPLHKRLNPIGLMTQDFDVHLRYLVPYCQRVAPSDVTLDYLPSVRRARHLRIHASDHLRFEMAKLLPSISVDEAGSHIAKSLMQNSTSWVLSHMAALYWRLKEDPVEAVRCLRVAINQTFDNSQRDLGYLSLAEMLHSAGRVDEALVAASMALRASPKIVLTHRFIANLYCAKGDLDKAVLFYESTLAMQSSLEDVKLRLRALLCGKILAEPDKYGRSGDLKSSSSPPPSEGD